MTARAEADATDADDAVTGAADADAVTGAAGADAGADADADAGADAVTDAVTDAGAAGKAAGRWAGQRGLVVLVAALALIGALAGVSWVVIIFVLVATLFLHELGHYVTARMTGMKVTEFFIGFGPRIWSFRWGETEYGIKAVWVGAYVRIIGMNNLDRVDASDEHRSFRRQSYPRKLLVLTAGSAVHFVMAVAFLFAVLVTHGPLWGLGADESSEVRDWSLATVSMQSAASAAGLQPGDELVSVDGMPRTTFDDFSRLVSQLQGTEVEVVYKRGGERRTAVTRVGERLTARGAAGIHGLIQGDRILEVEGLESDGPPTYAQLAEHARQRPGEALDITIVDARTGRGAVVEGAVVTETVSPSEGANGFFGVSADYRQAGLGVVEAAPESLRLFGTLVREVVVSMPKVVTEGLFGTIGGLLGSSEDAASAPVTASELESRRLDTSHPDENRILSIYGVARIGAEAASDGATDVLLLLAFVNVFIGVFNLLPLLPLDGGHVAVATYERLRSFGGRVHHVDAANLMPLTYAVVVLLLLIGGVALVRDILDPISFG